MAIVGGVVVIVVVACQSTILSLAVLLCYLRVLVSIGRAVRIQRLVNVMEDDSYWSYYRIES